MLLHFWPPVEGGVLHRPCQLCFRHACRKQGVPGLFLRLRRIAVSLGIGNIMSAFLKFTSLVRMLGSFSSGWRPSTAIRYKYCPSSESAIPVRGSSPNGSCGALVGVMAEVSTPLVTIWLPETALKTSLRSIGVPPSTPSPRQDGERVGVRGAGDWRHARLQRLPRLQRRQDRIQDTFDLAVDIVIAEPRHLVATIAQELFSLLIRRCSSSVE